MRLDPTDGGRRSRAGFLAEHGAVAGRRRWREASPPTPGSDARAAETGRSVLAVLDEERDEALYARWLAELAR
jgi:hypothetical protein